jgi:hypothetical protein
MFGNLVRVLRRCGAREEKHQADGQVFIRNLPLKARFYFNSGGRRTFGNVMMRAGELRFRTVGPAGLPADSQFEIAIRRLSPVV